MPTISKRRLPHQDLSQQPVHVNYRLYGSIPRAKIKELKKQHEEKRIEFERSYPLRHIDPIQQKEFVNNLEQLSEEYHQAYDQLLDAILIGPTCLRDPKIAEIIKQSWLTLQEWGRVIILAYCIMPNHVHVILQGPTDIPQPMGKIMGPHKRHTAREANLILGRIGPFWEPDYFDRDVRKGKFPIVLNYVLNNPVAAGLCKEWTDWPFTYVNPILEMPTL